MLKTGVQVLAGYLYHCLFPWLSLKQAIRSNNGTIIDFMWAYSLPWFRCSNKNQYAPLAVHHLFVMDMMSAPVREVWKQHRTGSLKGNCGRNVPWDMFNEKENNDFKRTMDGHVTRQRLSACATLLNGSKFLDGQFSASWGVEHEDEPSQYSHVKQSDVDGIVAKLETSLGSTRAALNVNRQRNPFGSGAAPWVEVETNGMAQLDEFIRRHLAGLPTNE